MKSIWKYKLSLAVEQKILMPQGAEILHLGLQHGMTCIWARVDPRVKTAPRIIRLAGTGTNDVPEDLPYIGTIMDGAYVWHFFDGGYVDGN